MIVADLVNYLESFAPVSLQEHYDNCGLLCGSPDAEITAVLLSIDVTEQVIDEAVLTGAGMIIAHHPLIFSPLRSLTGKNHVERTLISAVRNGLAIYAAHTSLDVVWHGVNRMICEKLGLGNIRVLSPRKDNLRKLVFFVPEDHAAKVRDAVFEAGAGVIGDYDRCSFNLHGEGSFRATGAANPFVGERGKLHLEKETRIEAIFRAPFQERIISALIRVHPYEEVAYDIYPLLNTDERTGQGMTGSLNEPAEEREFLGLLREVFRIPVIRHTSLLDRKISKVAVCGGSGAFLIDAAKSSGADAFITADIKYHHFFEADGMMLLADIGHYESEQYTTVVIHNLIREKFSKFAIHFSRVNTNPINYY